MQPTLICTPLTFYSQEDEDLLFEWFNKITNVEKLEGVGRELHVHIASNALSRKDLLNLMGIFDRYAFDVEQLSLFINDTNKHWLEPWIIKKTSKKNGKICPK